MERNRNKLIIVILTAVLFSVFSPIFICAEETALTKDGLVRLCGEIAEHSVTTVTPDYAGNPASDWLVYSCALAGIHTEGYLEALEDYVKREYETNGGLRLTTDYCRVAIVINALGGNPHRVSLGESNYTSLLNDGIINAEDFGRQGINAYIWSLIALYKCADKLSESERIVADAFSDMLIDYLLQSELSDGGFAFQGEKADPDVTAQALRALAPHIGGNDSVNKTTERCAELLFSMKNPDGTYSAFGTPNAETTAQVAIAFTALNKKTPLDLSGENNLIAACMKFYAGDDNGKGFRHIESDLKENVLATAQVLEAISVYLISEGESLKTSETEPDALAKLFSGFGAYINIALIMILIFILLLIMDRVAKRKK